MPFFYVRNNAYTEISYCKDIARKINWIGTKYFSCGTIEEEDDCIKFSFSLKYAVHGYTDDDLVFDLIKVRNYIKRYLEENPDSGLNDKKIQIYFRSYAEEYMSVYNYDFLTVAELNKATDFVYYDNIYVENISVIQELKDTRVLNAFGASEINELDFFAEWSELERFSIISYTFSDEEKDFLKELLSGCIIKFADEDG